MRKIAVFARGLMMSACVLLTMTACSEEELVAPEENGGADNNTTITTPTDIPMKTIRISAGMAQGEDGEMTRTTLNGRQVVWDEGDEYTIINEDPIGDSKTLRVVLNEPGSGLGIKAGSTTYFTYEDLKVVIGGKDVTKDIENTNTANNGFLVGAYNSASHYQYTVPGNSMFAKAYNNTGFGSSFAIASCDSKSNISKENKAVITIKGIQWGTSSANATNNTKATLLTKNTTTFVPNIKVSSSLTFKEPAEYYWIQGINSKVKLVSGQGSMPYGDFVGSIPAQSEVGENTMAVFPSSPHISYQNGQLKLEIPNTQEYYENSFDKKANIMIGKLNVANAEEENVYDAEFSNMMGVFTLSMKGDNDFISEIAITDQNKNICGTATINVNEYKNKGISTDDITVGNSTIRMICSTPVELTSEAKKFYFVVPVGAFEGGFDVEVTTVDGRKMKKSTSKSNVIKRNTIKNMPAFDTDFNIPELNVENDELQKYLDYALTNYTTWTTSTRETKTYFSSTTIKNSVKDQDHPRYYNASWAGQANATYYITLTDNTKGVNVFENRPVSGTSYDIMNLVPGHKYKYVVTDGSKNISSGKFKATGRVRMITVDDTWNFRDMGGWTGLNGNKVQYEWLYRCGSLNGKSKIGTGAISGTDKRDKIADPNNYEFFTEKSRQQLIDLGIKGELDLRSIRTEEDITSYYTHSYSINTPHTGIDGWLFERHKFNGVQSNPTLQSSDVVIDCMAWIIKQVVYNNNPVAFHCKSGADRTGMLAYLIHSLLGVELTGLAVDFETTNFSHEQKEVKGSSEFRDKVLTENVLGMFNNDINFMICKKGTRQENAYYYLNQYFNNKKIKASDLNKFIEKMLGMEAGSYTAPQWATEEGVTIEKDN